MPDISQHLIRGRKFLDQLERLAAMPNKVDAKELWSAGNGLVFEVNQTMICIDQMCNKKIDMETNNA